MPHRFYYRVEDDDGVGAHIGRNARYFSVRLRFVSVSVSISISISIGLITNVNISERNIYKSKNKSRSEDSNENRAMSRSMDQCQVRSIPTYLHSIFILPEHLITSNL